METSPVPRSDWADWQNDLIVTEYFKLDRIQREGGRVVKTDLYEQLGVQVGRKPGGVENKFQNISAVLASLQMEYARGLKPRPNIQQSLADAVERFLDANPLLVYGAPVPPTVDPGEIVEVAVPERSPERPKIERTVERIARKYNYAERDARNRRLGQLGEQLVCERERLRLLRAGKASLAKHVRHVSLLDGDGVGYDIRSFEPTGEERLIEVKTTNGPATTDFFLSRTERDVSLERSDLWRLHRVHLFSTSPRIFVMAAPLGRAVTLSPETWRASF